MSNKKIRLDIIGLSSSQSQVGHYALVLGEVSGNRRLPIIIGGAEAQAIALELENIKTNRPMTHDLIFNLARHFEINLVEIIINDLSEGIFYALLVMEVDGEIHEIDAQRIILMGDLNADPGDLPTLTLLTKNYGWTDIGA